VLHVLVLCGGQSTEHAISIISAKNVVANLDKTKYRVSIAYILQDARWLYIEHDADFLDHDAETVATKPAAVYLHFSPGNPHPFIITTSPPRPISFDCVFPMLHGTHGEDGAMQGFLEILGVPYVGADVLASSLIMDKDTSKRLLRAANLPVVDWILVQKHTSQDICYDELSKKLGRTLFVKPNNLGSSVGVSKVQSEQALQVALHNAFCFDDRVLIEKAIIGREIECSVLGNEQPICAMPGEVIVHAEFYSYSAKYLEETAATIKTPADHLSPECIARFQTLSIRAFQTLRCAGMARVDFFLTRDEVIYINELNTIPGFTSISLYPQNWVMSGITYSQLLDRLIELSLSRFQEKKMLNRIYDPYTKIESIAK